MCPEARTAIETLLNLRLKQCISTQTVLEMMDMVQENNSFSFANKHYIQKEGTAIGSHLGMNYASTYLGSWEKKLMDQANHLPYAYYRYVWRCVGPLGTWRRNIKAFPWIGKYNPSTHTGNIMRFEKAFRVPRCPYFNCKQPFSLSKIMKQLHIYSNTCAMSMFTTFFHSTHCVFTYILT